MDISLAYFKLAPRDARSLVPAFAALGVPVHDLGLRPGREDVGLRRLVAVIRALRPDLVHTHLLRADLFGLPIARLLRVPGRVSSVHALEPLFRRPILRSALRFAYQQSGRVVAISDAVRRELRSTVRVSDSRLRVIPYGIEPVTRAEEDDARSVRVEFGIPEGAPLIGCVGRLNAVKGHRYLVAAMPEILRVFPDVRLLIVGHDDGQRDVLEVSIRDLGLNGTVLLIGQRTDIPRLMAAFDLFALPSLSEGLGQVLLEAMHVRKAVVASGVDAIPEVVADRVTGLLVPPRDPRALAEAIINLLMNPDVRREMGYAGYHRALREFSVATMVQRTMDIYREVLDR